MLARVVMAIGSSGVSNINNPHHDSLLSQTRSGARAIWDKAIKLFLKWIQVGLLSIYKAGDDKEKRA